MELLSGRAVRAILRRADSDERGALSILVAMFLIVLTALAALVVDVSDAETEVRANQVRADFAAMAAATWLPEDPVRACQAAWIYLRVNAPGLPSGASSPCDSGIPSTFKSECDDVATLPTTYEALGEWPFEITFTYPVPDGHPALQGRAGSNDGASCQRFAISVSSTRPSVFGKLVGSAGLVARASAVSRGFVSLDTSAAVALLLFDPVGCEPLKAIGNGGVEVFPSGDLTGFIGIDSDGTDAGCDPSDAYTVDAEGTGGRAWVCGVGSTLSPESCLPGGIMGIYAMDPGQLSCSGPDPDPCDPSDVAAGRVKPQPSRLGARLTRAPVDHRYNCKASYPKYLGIVTIAGCPTATADSDFIDELRAYVGTTGAPIGFTEYAASACDTSASGLPIVVPPGNWWVNCPVFTIKKPVTFLGGNIVFQGSVNLTSQGSLAINTVNPLPNLPANCLTVLCPTVSSATHSWVYIRANGSASTTSEGFVRSGQAPLTMNNVAMYIHDAGNKGYFNLSGGTGAFTWASPTEGPLEDLVLWSESNLEHVLAGQSAQTIEGTMFMPFANPFHYSGQGSQSQTNAQFLAYRLLADGQGQLLMQVDPDRATPIPLKALLLIR